MKSAIGVWVVVSLVATIALVLLSLLWPDGDHPAPNTPSLVPAAASTPTTDVQGMAHGLIAEIVPAVALQVQVAALEADLDIVKRSHLRLRKLLCDVSLADTSGMVRAKGFTPVPCERVYAEYRDAIGE